MSLSVLFLIFLGYILYRFVVGFVLPVARTTRTMRQQFDQMKQQQDYTAEEPAASAGNRRQSSSFTEAKEQPQEQRTTSGRKGAKEDYIDFEEIPASKY